MVVLIGYTVAKSKCKNCGGEIHLTSWSETSEDEWTHDVGDGSLSRTCAGAPVAEPTEVIQMGSLQE